MQMLSSRKARYLNIATPILNHIFQFCSIHSSHAKKQEACVCNRGPGQPEDVKLEV